jgi:hypothetical protein
MLLVACAGASSTPRAVDRASTDDPPPARFGAAVPLSAGREQAHELVVSLVQALADEDEAGVLGFLAPRLERAVPMREDGPAHAAIERAVYLRQLMASVRAARLMPGTLASDLIEPRSMQVETVADVFEAGTIPRDIEPTDLVVRFRIAPAGRRALAALGASGAAQLIVRPGPRPQVVAR